MIKKIKDYTIRFIVAALFILAMSIPSTIEGWL